jgi:hypothetical protein
VQLFARSHTGAMADPVPGVTIAHGRLGSVVAEGYAGTRSRRLTRRCRWANPSAPGTCQTCWDPISSRHTLPPNRPCRLTKLSVKLGQRPLVCRIRAVQSAGGRQLGGDHVLCCCVRSHVEVSDVMPQYRLTKLPALDTDSSTDPPEVWRSLTPSGRRQLNR